MYPSHSSPSLPPPSLNKVIYAFYLIGTMIKLHLHQGNPQNFCLNWYLSTGFCFPLFHRGLFSNSWIPQVVFFIMNSMSYRRKLGEFDCFQVDLIWFITQFQIFLRQAVITPLRIIYLLNRELIPSTSRNTHVFNSLDVDNQFLLFNHLI